MTIDLTHLERLGSISLAAWHARRKQRLASATASGAVVPEAVLVPAQQLRARMLKLVEYYFDEDDSLGPLVAAIRSGAGYQDLASDLHALADVYSRPVVEAVISQDPKFYQADDVATARRYAGEILSSLGMDATADAKHWTEMAQRAWTLLDETYREIQAAGLFLFRKDPDAAEQYPSLVSAVRRRPRQHAAEPELTSEPEPAAPTP